MIHSGFQIGVAGFLLGGGRSLSVPPHTGIPLILIARAGYSFKTNEYGLAVDNIVAFNVVLPNGTPVKVTAGEHEDLFWALKVRLFETAETELLF